MNMILIRVLFACLLLVGCQKVASEDFLNQPRERNRVFKKQTINQLNAIMNDPNWQFEKFDKEESDANDMVGDLYMVRNSIGIIFYVFKHNNTEVILNTKERVSYLCSVNRKTLIPDEIPSVITTFLLKDRGIVAGNNGDSMRRNEENGWLHGSETDSDEFKRLFESTPKFSENADGNWTSVFYVFTKFGSVFQVEASGTMKPFKIEKVESKKIKKDGSYSWPLLGQPILEPTRQP